MNINNNGVNVSRRDKEEVKADNAETNLVIFEGLFGAKRQRLANDMCGLVSAGGVHGSFAGHELFYHAELWVMHYRGPDFCKDLVQMHAAEDRLADKGWHRNYAQTLVQAVCSKYRRLTKDEEVVDFWFAVAHATAAQRARAAAHAIREVKRHG